MNLRGRPVSNKKRQTIFKNQIIANPVIKIKKRLEQTNLYLNGSQ